MPRDEILNSAKDKQLTVYQKQLLDDNWKMQQINAVNGDKD